MSLEEQTEKKQQRPRAPYMKPTDISDPNYSHKVVDCQWACLLLSVGGERGSWVPTPPHVLLTACVHRGATLVFAWISAVSNHSAENVLVQ